MCFHVMLTMDYIQALLELKDFDLYILYLHVFAIFYQLEFQF